jgi:hypothetical protein
MAEYRARPRGKASTAISASSASRCSPSIAERSSACFVEVGNVILRFTRSIGVILGSLTIQNEIIERSQSVEELLPRRAPVLWSCRQPCALPLLDDLQQVSFDLRARLMQFRTLG